MSDLVALLSAIYERPDDDAARAVYADALLERGDPRGELIAVQLLRPDASRAKKLLDQHGRQWLGALAAVTLRYEFERGFPVKLAIDSTLESELRRVAHDPSWSTIAVVELGGSRALTKLQKAAIRTLANAPGFARREFRPSLTDLAASEAGRRAPRKRVL